MLKKVDLHKSGATALSNTYTYKKRSSTSSYISGLVEKEVIKCNGTSIRSYEYDAMGRVISIKTDLVFGNNSYMYDYRGFLTGTDSETFKYDANGNITSYNGTTFGYDATIKDKLIRVGSNAVNYANAESLNPTSWDGRSYSYEGRRLTRFTYGGIACSYEYDDQSRRIKKVVGGNTTNYYYSGDLLVCEVGPNGRLDFLYDENGQLYGFIKDNSSKYFYVKDMLGTILGIVDESGNIVVKYNNYTYGRSPITYDPLNIAKINPFSAQASWLLATEKLHKNKNPPAMRVDLLALIKIKNKETIIRQNCYI